MQIKGLLVFGNVALLAASVACSDSTGPGGDAGDGDGADGDTGDVDTVCNPVTNSVCVGTEKCARHTASEDPFTASTECGPDGTVGPGEACGIIPETGFDNCAGTHTCVNQVCSENCTVDPDSCGSGESCLIFDGVFEDRDGLGVCQPTCDVLAPSCAGTDGCYLHLATGTAQCNAALTPSGGSAPSVQGEPCPYQNNCAAGYGCHLPVDPNDATQGQQCVFYCDTSGSGGPSCADGPGPSFECVAFNAFFTGTSVPEGIGFCVQCDDWASNAACLTP